MQLWKETQSAERGSSEFSLCGETLLSIPFNWKVMQFLFKEMTRVYEDRLPRGRRDGLIWVRFYVRGESTPVYSFDNAVVLNDMAFISALPSGSHYLSN